MFTLKESNNCLSKLKIIKPYEGKNIVIGGGAIYIAYNNYLESLYESLETSLNILSQEHEGAYLIGDFNIDILLSLQDNDVSTHRN